MHSSRADSQRREELRAERMQQALRTAGREQTLEGVREALRDIWQWLEATYWDHNVDPGFDAQIEWLRQRFGIAASDSRLLEEIQTGFVDPIFDVPPTVDPAAVTTLERTQCMGLKVGLICNTSITPGTALRQLLAQWGLDRLLPVQVYSCEFGTRKPTPEIFEEAARRLGLKVSAMLHVGDHEVNDVQGALGAGAQAIQVGPNLPLERVSAIIATKLNS